MELPRNNSALDLTALKLVPKVLLHDHLDGGLRPQTIIELAAEVNYNQLPQSEPNALAAWFRESASRDSLVHYLEAFTHTVAVMQTAPALRRVARECVIDLAADGVVYAEIRFAPELHLEQGLTLKAVCEAVLAGFKEGETIVGGGGKSITVVALVTAMRHAARSLEIAELAVLFRDKGVVGFDIAGAESGFPPSRHLDAFEYLRAENAHFTIHAGEAFGLPSIHEALALCGADRLGHGVRVIDDIFLEPGANPKLAKLGKLAAYVRDKRIPLELCPSSNVQTGAVTSMKGHPIYLLAALRFRVTINTDNRLMSNTTMSNEMYKLVEAFNFRWEDLERFTINAMKSSFISFDQRLRFIDEVIKPGFARMLE